MAFDNFIVSSMFVDEKPLPRKLSWLRHRAFADIDDGLHAGMVVELKRSRD
jgi:hypothetical protein